MGEISLMEKRVCVTGASGYIAANLIEQLIKGGYKVHGTVRSLENKQKIEPLSKLSSTELTLFEADLLKPFSFDKAFEGCSVVFHTASPFQLQANDPVKELVEPALQGTLNVLESVKKAKISRVILTSSVAAIVGETKISDDKVYSEEDWNLESKPTNAVAGYRYSKRVAEEAAWKFAKENDIDLTTINPSFVLGPSLSNRTDSTSIKTVIGLLAGFFKNGAGPSCYGCVDVRDVALAHVRALECSGKGKEIHDYERKLFQPSRSERNNPRYSHRKSFGAC